MNSKLINSTTQLKFRTPILHTKLKNCNIPFTICCGLRRGARKQLWKGVAMSKEAIHVVQKLKLAKSSKANDSHRMNQVFNECVGRLLNGDLVMVLEELRRQNEWEIVLKVFDYMRKEDSFKRDLSLYSDMILMLGKNGLIELAENLFSEIKKEGLEPNTRVYTEMVGAYLKFGKVDKAMDLYEQMKNSGHNPDKLTLTILIRNLVKTGEEELACAVRKDCEKYIDYSELKKFLEEIDKPHLRRRSLKLF